MEISSLDLTSLNLASLHKARQAVPLLLRHFTAYLDLIEKDFAAAKAAATARALIFAVLAMSSLLLLMMVCALVIAATWDGEYRILSIALMGTLFASIVVATIVALRRKSPDSFAALRHEWREDREILKYWLSKDDVQDEPLTASPARPAGVHAS